MATPETALLADFDFDLTSNANATPLAPRPPTPDPRRTPTPHPPQRSKPPTLPTDTDTAPKRLRKKPTAIFIGSEPKGQDVAFKPCQGEAHPFFDFARPSHHTLPSLLPLLPSTPSPRFASSPSLSSSATTVQSSPTLTPTTPHFASSYSEPQRDTKAFEAFNTWDYNQGTFGLRRAKRLPRREQGLWEVHAVVHIGEGGGDCGSSSGKGQGPDHGQVPEQSSHKHYEWCLQQQRQAGFLANALSPESVATNIAAAERSSAQRKPPVIQNNATPRNIKLESFQGIHSESARREGGLRKTQTGESSNFSLSKYQFPAPPGDYRVGLSGDLQHPTRVHYRGASFDLVNPHASLILSSPHFETPAELDGFLDNYFEDQAAMPRALYTDAESARRDIMRLGDVDEAAPAETSSHESSAASLVPTRVRSDPFDLRVTDVPSQATQLVRSSTAGASTIGDIVEGYDYTRETPFENELSLRALESGSMGKQSGEASGQLSEEVQQGISAGFSAMTSGSMSEQSEEASGQLSEEVQQGVSAGFSAMASEVPTSDRSYGDTGRLLNITPRQPHQGIPPTTMPSSAPGVASGLPSTRTAAAQPRRPGAGFGLFCDTSSDGSSPSQSPQRHRRRILVDESYRAPANPTTETATAQPRRPQNYRAPAIPITETATAQLRLQNYRAPAIPTTETATAQLRPQNYRAPVNPTAETVKAQPRRPPNYRAPANPTIETATADSRRPGATFSLFCDLSSDGSSPSKSPQRHRGPIDPNYRAPANPTTDTTIAEPRRPYATSSPYCESAESDFHSSQRARGRILVDPNHRDISSNTVQSDGEDDWETTRSESRAEIHPGLPRPSVESYANTSTYDENNRLSAMSDAPAAGSQFYRPYRAAHIRPPMAAESNEGDVDRARKALKKIYNDKVLDQSMMASMVGDQTAPKETRRQGRGILQNLRDRRESAILQAHDNDIELEEIRKKNPQAVRLAADQIYAENAPGQLTPQRAPMPLGRLRNVFNRGNPTAEQLANRDIMDEVIAADDNRNLLAATPTTICSSRLAFSESANTFRTFRDEEYIPSPLDYKSRAALDLGERPYSPAVPAATYSPDQSRARRPNPVSESHHHGRAKAPRKPARRAATSSQTSLRALITTGSPTSNIQGAFTDREMAEASRRWDLLPRHHNYYRRTQGMNASGPFPRFYNSPFHPANPQGRMLMRPSEVMDPKTLLLQERLSKCFLMRILAFPPLCFLYYSGHYDYWIANKSNGKVKAMSPSRKEDALSWAVLLSIVYCLIIIGIVVSVAIIKEN